MISAKKDLPMYGMRPSIKMSWYSRFKFVIRPLTRWRWRSRDAVRVTETLNSLVHCRDREELENILGRPRYALLPGLFGSMTPGGERRCPDAVETYIHSGYIYDVLYFFESTTLEVYATDMYKAAQCFAAKINQHDEKG